MKFIVNSQQLHKQLQSLSGVLSSSNTMPIIGCFHFHLEENNLTIKTTDLTTTLMARMTVETGRMEHPEEVAVPSRMLLDILKTFDDVPLTFDVNPSNFSIDIVSGQGQYRLAGMDAATYPTMPVAESTSKIEMSSTALVNAINKTVFATSNDEMHQQMSGIFCEMTPDGVTFVATDAHKLVRYRRKDVTSDESTNFILPKKPIIIVKNILAARKEEGDVTIEYNNTNHLRQLLHRLPPGRRPLPQLRGRHPQGQPQQAHPRPPVVPQHPQACLHLRLRGHPSGPPLHLGRPHRHLRRRPRALEQRSRDHPLPVRGRPHGHRIQRQIPHRDDLLPRQ